jgi:hypothetical protein
MEVGGMSEPRSKISKCRGVMRGRQAGDESAASVQKAVWQMAGINGEKMKQVWTERRRNLRRAR